MKILITGNLGYVGAVLIPHLRQAFPGAHLVGYDNGYFAHCLTNANEYPERHADVQYWGDIRDIDERHVRGMDAVVHLSAVSNDPMGHRYEAVTAAINRDATKNVASLAKRLNVRRLVFASSCSIYGFAEGGPRKESDALNPLTAYARSKVESEKALSAVAGPGMVITALRFATACGMSARLRLDLVLNDFVACALSCGEITVLSDGSPWRPLIDVKDMARAIEWALLREARGNNFLAVNAGSDEWNYQVRDLANTVASEIPGTTVSINANAQPDARSYRVDFSLYNALAPVHQPQVNLQTAVRELRHGLQGMGFADRNFRSSQFIRLRMLERHIGEGRLGEDLRWLSHDRAKAAGAAREIHSSIS
jgi:nucleoside-diphosphate-sugar epimerase